MLRSSPRLRALVALLSASALGTTLLLGVPGADAASPYCAAVASVGPIVSPALPTHDTVSSMTSALLRLPSVISALHGDDVKLVKAASLSSDAVSSDFLRAATSDVAVETAALTSAVNQELNAVLNSSSATLMSLAKEFVVASNAAASANAYLSANRTVDLGTCS
jgi:hypothetical protein